MKAKIYQLQSLFSKIDNPYISFIFFGTDEGEINKGFQKLKEFLGCQNDDLNTIRLTSDQIKKNPFIATDEANTVSLMGGRRIILIEEEAVFSDTALVHFLDHRKTDALLLIKAGNLSKTSALRKEAESNPFVLAFACYPPTEIELKTNIQTQLTQANKTISTTVLDALVQKLTSHAGIIEQEINKLLIYLGDKKNITLEAIKAIITDSKETSLDDFCVMLANGKTDKIHSALQAFEQENIQLSSLLWSVTNYFTILAKLVENKRFSDIQEKILTKNLKPNQFKLKAPLLAQAQKWTSPQILSVLEKLQALEQNTRQTNMPAECIMAHTFIQLSEFAKKLSGMR
ncbi:MAG: DNA polymerase III subunit delta [Alphaproteobacteria bacterium]|nr:DNA polymerase III subunit delta [Alphaproteobacteria bacterium]